MQTFITLYILLGVFFTCGFYYADNDKKHTLNDNSVKKLILVAVLGVLILPITITIHLTIRLIMRLLKKLG